MCVCLYLFVHFLCVFVYMCSFVCPSIHSSSQILLPRNLMNALNNSDKTDKDYSLARTDVLDTFCRLKVKVTAAVEVAEVSTSTLGCQSPTFSLSPCHFYMSLLHVSNCSLGIGSLSLC